jgi:hemerythrin-like domain-containing protein
MADPAAEPSGDFFAALLRDHAEIERRLAELDRAALVLSRTEIDHAALEVVRATLGYFSSEGARHEAHEEQTLFPRLRPLPEFAQILSALEFQHRMNGSAARELAACAERFAPGSGRELRFLAYRFAEMHRGHAVAEERALFPLAASRLAPEAQAEMVREMRARNAARGRSGTREPD